MFSSAQKKSQEAIENTKKKIEDYANLKKKETPDMPSLSVRVPSSLKSLKMAGQETNQGSDKGGIKDSFENIRAPRKDESLLEEEFEPVLMLDPTNKSRRENFEMQHKAIRFSQIGSLFLSALWVGLSASYLFNVANIDGAVFQQPHVLGGYIAGILAPVALIWMIMGYFQRQNDIHHYSTILREELQSMIFPSDERRMAVHKDIEELCKQAAELSTASKSVLRSIHKARMGLRMEVKEFSNISASAEKHILGLTSALDQKVITLNQSITTIEDQISKVDEKTQNTQKSWDDISNIVVDKAKNIETILGTGADKLLEAASQTEQKTHSISNNLDQSFKSLKETVDRASERFELLNTTFSSQKTELSDVTNHIVEETSRLGEVISIQVKDLDDMTQKTVESLQKAGETIKDSQNEFIDGTVHVQERSEDMIRAIEESAEKIRSSSDYAASKAEEMQSQVALKAKDLETTISNLDLQADAIDRVGDTVANRISESLSSVLSATENLNAAARKSAEIMGRSSDDLEEKHVKALQAQSEHVESLENTSQAYYTQMNALSNLLEETLQKILHASEDTRKQIQESKEYIETQDQELGMSQNSFLERIEGLQTILDKPMTQFSDALHQGKQYHEQIVQTVDRRIDALSDSTEKLKEAAGLIQSSLKTQAQDITSMAGNIIGQSRSVNKAMEEQKGSLDSIVQTSLEDLRSIHQKLVDESENLSTITTNSMGDLERFDKKLTEKTQRLGEMAGDTSIDLDKIEERISEKVRMLEQKCDQALSSVSDVRSALEKSTEDMVPMYETTLDKITDTHSKFETLKEGYIQASDSNLEKMRSVGIHFGDALEALEKGSETASTVLKDTGDMLYARVQDIEEAASSAKSKIMDIETILDNQSSDIHLLADQAILKIEDVQRAIDSQFQDLSLSVGHAVSQVTGAGEQFKECQKQLDDAAIDITNRILSVCETTKEQTDALNDASKNSTNLTRMLVSDLVGESQKLLKSSEDSLASLQKISEGFAFRNREVSEQIKIGFKTAQSYSAELRQQAREFSEASEQTADTISNSVQTLSTKMAEVGTMAQDVSVKVQDASKTLSHETQNLDHTSRKALKSAEEAGSIFSKQSDALFKASKDAVDFANKIRQSEWRTQRDGFFASAKFVVESLHSLSVDITRMLEGEVPEKTWKAFQKGDIAAFTQRLVMIREDIPVEKVRKKYTEDSEFRNYVNRYLRQFEEVFEQAAQNDHSDLLASTFYSSDVGKLYEYLCNVCGREPKSEKYRKKAA